MAQRYTLRSGIWVPHTDELHRADPAAHAGVLVAEGDARLTNARTPTAHASSHYAGGADELDVAQLGGFPGTTTTFLRGDGAFGSVSAAANLWDARVQPTGTVPPLHAHSSNFEDDTWRTGATAWDHGGILTTSTDTTYRTLRLELANGTGGNRAAGLYYPVPSEEFTVIGYLSTDRNNLAIAGQSMGVAFFADPTLATADWGGGSFTGAFTSAATCSFHVTSQWNAARGNTVLETRSANTMASIWIRCRCTGSLGAVTAVEVDWSDAVDGDNWRPTAGVTALGYSATHYGPTIFSNAGGVRYGNVKYWRVFDGVSGFYDTRNGGYLAT